MLKLNNNQLSRIPFAIRRMKALRYLHLANNELASLPSTLDRMTFDTIDVSGPNMFATRRPDQPYAELGNGDCAGSLLYLTANTVISRRLKYTERTLPTDVIDILEASPFCPCGKLCAVSRAERTSSCLSIRSNAFIRTTPHIPTDVVYCTAKCRSILVHKTK